MFLLNRVNFSIKFDKKKCDIANIRDIYKKAR